MGVDVPPGFWSCWWSVCTHSDGVWTLGGEGGEVGFSVRGAGGRWRGWMRGEGRERGGWTEDWRLLQGESLLPTERHWGGGGKTSFIHYSSDINWDWYDWCGSRWSSPDRVAAAVGGVGYPGNKKLLWGSVRLHPPWQTEFHKCINIFFKQ